jgi:hypothetical protein
VQLSSNVRIVRVPVLSGAMITLAPALDHPALEEPVGFLGGIALAPLVAGLRAPVASNGVISLWALRMDADVARGVLGWMHATGIVEARDG